MKCAELTVLPVMIGLAQDAMRVTTLLAVELAISLHRGIVQLAPLIAPVVFIIWDVVVKAVVPAQPANNVVLISTELIVAGQVLDPVLTVHIVIQALTWWGVVPIL